MTLDKTLLKIISEALRLYVATNGGDPAFDFDKLVTAQDMLELINSKIEEK